MAPSDERQNRSPIANDDWTPPPWRSAPAVSPRPDSSGREETTPSSPTRATRTSSTRTIRPPVEEHRESDVYDRHTLEIALSQAVIGIVALITSFIGLWDDQVGAAPVAVLVVAAVCLLGLLVSHFEELRALRTSWAVCLATTVLVVPTGAIQVTMARQPYAGTKFGSNGPLLVATMSLAFILILSAFAIAIVSRQSAGEAALIFMSMALFVPALIGVRSSLTAVDSIQALAESLLIAALASVIAWSVPPPRRLLIAPGALAVQFILLWILGRGPSFSASHGRLVPITQGGLLALTVLLVVGVPIVAMWSKRFLDEPHRDVSLAG